MSRVLLSFVLTFLPERRKLGSCELISGQSAVGWRPESALFPLKLSVQRHLLLHLWPSATPWSVAHQPALSMGFSSQEHWSGLPFPAPTSYWLVPYKYLKLWKKIYQLGFPGGSDSKESACDAGDWGSVPGSGRWPSLNTSSLYIMKLSLRKSKAKLCFD